jgi:hypothetical protein
MVSRAERNIFEDLGRELLMLCGGFFFLDKIVDHARHTAAAEASGELVVGFTFGVAHETPVEGLFSTHIIVVIKGQFSALAAL